MAGKVWESVSKHTGQGDIVIVNHTHKTENGASLTKSNDTLRKLRNGGEEVRVMEETTVLHQLNDLVGILLLLNFVACIFMDMDPTTMLVYNNFRVGNS